VENPLSLALQITVVGMGLVFGAILLLWAVMAVLMRLTQERAPVEAEAEPPADLDIKQRAALAALAVALAREASAELHEFPLPPTAQVSAWQTVMRTKMLNKRGSVR
jgi:Na+-transporting methylmalonyl-CoA/oxaloacetate decarboxylase gamma subunit